VHVAAEHALERRVELEEAPVEERGGVVGDGRNNCEALLDQGEKS